MLLDRRSALAAALLSLAVAGCGGSPSDSAQQPPSSHAASASWSAPLSSPASSLPASSPAASSPAASTTAPRPSASPIKIGTNLCSGADVAQNTADAYMGALSANDAQQASACVLPGTVPAAITRSLLASSSMTAVYLPRDGADGPSVFGYRGNGKLIDVTISKQPDGQFWVTEVAVGSA